MFYFENNKPVVGFPESACLPASFTFRAFLQCAVVCKTNIFEVLLQFFENTQPISILVLSSAVLMVFITPYRHPEVLLIYSLIIMQNSVRFDTNSEPG